MARNLMRRVGALLLVLGWMAVVQAQQSSIYYPYANGCKESVASGKSLVVFVGHIPNIEVKGVVHAAIPALEGYPAKCIVVSVPEKGDIYWKATLPTTATESQVLATLRKEVTAAAVVPFRQQQHCPT